MFLLLLFVLKDEQEMHDFMSSINMNHKRSQHMFGRRYALEHLGLTNEELQEALVLSKSEGLVNPIKRGKNQDDHLSYQITDKALYDLIENYLVLAIYIRIKLILIWSHIRKPTIEERKWFELFFSRKDFYNALEIYNK